MAIQYFESKNVKVYPSAYRGAFDRDTGLPITPETTKTTTFDPEARLTTEKVLLGNSISDLKGSYVIDYANDTLKCVIGGYYFEIYNLTAANLPQYLGIKLLTKTLTDADPNAIEISRTTEILDSFKDSLSTPGLTLDQYNSTTQKWEFTGLAYDNSVISGNGVKILYLGTNNKIFAASKLVKHIYNLPTDNNQTVAGAIRLGIPNYNELYAADPSGRNAIVVGCDTNNLFPKATGDFSIAGGTKTIAGGNNSVALGTGTETTSDSQFAFGKYNDTTVSNAVEMIGWGTSSAKKNIRVLDTSGNETLSGKIVAAGADLDGNIDINDDVNNDAHNVNIFGGTTLNGEPNGGVYINYGTNTKGYTFIGNSTGYTAIKGYGTSIYCESGGSNIISGPTKINYTSTYATNIGNSTGALTLTGSTITTNGPITANNLITGTITKAQQDESGNNIKASYANKLEVSDATLTLKNKNNTQLSQVTVNNVNNANIANAVKATVDGTASNYSIVITSTAPVDPLTNTLYFIY